MLYQTNNAYRHCRIFQRISTKLLKLISEINNTTLTRKVRKTMQDTPARQNSVDSWISQYERVRPIYEELCKRLKTLLETLLSRASIKYHIVEERAKTVESFSEKLHRAGKTYTNPLKEITDLAALRIIVYYEDDVDLVCNLLENEFNVDPRSIDKRAVLEPDRFGYLSVHKIVALSRSRAKLPEWSTFSELVAEIQVRTVLQHAWAAISHELQYKNEKEIPVQLRRKLVRLSGLLDLADEQFSELRQKQEKLSQEISERIEIKDLEISINSLSLSKFIQTSVVVNELMKIVSQKEHLKVGTEQDELALRGSSKIIGGISQLVSVCEITGIKNIKNLEKQLIELSPKAESFFSKFASERKVETIGAQAHWVAVLITAGNFNETIRSEIKNRGLWDNDYTVDIGKIRKVVFG